MRTPPIAARSVPLALLAAFFPCSISFAQVSHGGEPRALLYDLGTPVPVVVVQPPDVAAYMAEDEARGHRPLRYGALIDLDLGIADGLMSELPDGSRAWRLRIQAPGAKSLAIEFDALVLPPQARMYVYNAATDVVLGSYIDENVHPEGDFVFEPLRGSELTLEIDLPAGVADPALRTRALIWDYRDVFALADGSANVHEEEEGFLGACLIDVNCPQGANWPTQKRATVRTLSGGSLCSGALINNTSSDGTRYLLTADHCGQTTSTVFTFLYQRSGCSSGAATESFTVTGATLLATNGTVDCRLMRISTAIPQSYQPYFAGWTRTTANAATAFAMGHPGGGPKKISIAGSGTVGETNQWRVFWTEGMLQGGSSGGPLFDQLGRLRGPACCVTNFTCGSQTAWFGRFDRFWNLNNLAQWLDPTGTNQTDCPGHDPSAPTCTEGTANFCIAAPNSTGSGAPIASSGNTDLSENQFTLYCFGIRPNQNAIFYYGTTPVQVPFGHGFRCVGGATFRLPIIQADGVGDLTFHLNFTQPPANSGPGQILPGSTWHFQAWYRDPPAGAPGFNLSDGLTATFCQ